MNAIQQLNLAIRFLLELGVLAAVGAAALRVVDGSLRWVAALATVLALAVVWGMLVSPRAPVAVPLAGRLAIEAAVFATGVAALVVVDRLPWAVVLGAIAVTNRVLILVWNQ